MLIECNSLFTKNLKVYDYGIKMKGDEMNESCNS